MIVFETERLIVRLLKDPDKSWFYELLTKPEIVEPIPHAPFSDEVVSERFHFYRSQGVDHLSYEKCCWAITEKDSDEVIGLALLLTNDERLRELGYRFRTEYWGQGYGTEIAKGIIDFSFDTLELEWISADANVRNDKSNRILKKFLTFDKEVFDERFDSLNNRYLLKREDWKSS